MTRRVLYGTVALGGIFAAGLALGFPRETLFIAGLWLLCPAAMYFGMRAMGHDGAAGCPTANNKDRQLEKEQ